MKNIIANLSLVFMMSMALVPSYAENLSEQVADNNRSVNPYEGSFSYDASSPVDIQLPNFSLTADSGSLLHGVDIQVSMLPNVCLLSDGVRLLPNGEHFSEDAPALVTLAYDPARIPMGYTPKDIYTYYSDDNTHWHRLERVSVDTVAHTILSFTTHFTDFANAVIKVPEMPESKAFVPTAMTDIPDINPMQGIPMVEAPTANNRGTAELTYPIELPKGRHGMQPNVDLHYSSAGGNGVLGVGWSLSSPAITIDTRWGVPRYDPIYETEQYLVNGAPVLFRDERGMAESLPYQDTVFQRREDHTVRTRFYARDTKNQDRIIRYGTNPTDYWWGVTDRNGITTYYGRSFDPTDPDDNSIDEESVVRTGGPNSNIAYWAATASVDVYGNYVRYINDKEGNMIYVRQIDYTGNCGKEALAPTYRVKMDYTHRKDVSTNGRLGVLQREERLLCHVLVQYLHPDYNKEGIGAENLAAYYMQYSDPNKENLYKSRLDKVVMLDSVRYLMLDNMCDLSAIISEDYMKYNTVLLKLAIKEAYEKGNGRLAEQLYMALEKPYGENSIPANVTEFSYADAPLTKNRFNTNIQYLSNPSGKELVRSESTGWSLGGSLTVGPGFDVKTTIVSGGANYDYSRSNGGCKTMLLDLNGDGLQDLVYEDKGKVYYCKQEKQGNRFAAPFLLHGLTRLSHEVSDTHTWGLQLSFGADLSYSNPMTTSYTDVYFSDINADGLPDMIDGEYIRINHLDEKENPYFGEFTGVESQKITIHNSCSNKGVIMNGEVDEHIECELREVPVKAVALRDHFKPIEPQGIGAEKIDVPEIIYPKKEYSDGKTLDYEGRETVFQEIEEETSEPPVIEAKSHPRKVMMATDSADFSADEGDLIYKIEGDSIKAYRLEYICRPANLDPKIEIVRVWVAPDSGTITLADRIQLIEDRSKSRSHSIKADGVTYSIQHCHSVTTLNDSAHLHADAYSVLRESSLGAGDYDMQPWDSTFYVQKGDVLMFRLRSGDNNSFDKTNWHHIIQYSGKSKIYDSEKDFICTGDGHFQAYKKGEVILTFSGNNEGTKPVRLRVMKNTQIHEEHTLQGGTINLSIRPLNVDSSDNVYIQLSSIQAGSAEPRWSDIHLYPKLQYITSFPRDGSNVTYQDTVVYYPDVQITNYSSVVSDMASPYRKLFGTLHQGWGGFAYQNIDTNDTIENDIIIIDSLVNTQLLAVQQMPPESEISTTDTSFVHTCTNDSLVSRFKTEFANSNAYDPLSDYWIPMRTDSRTEQYIAYGNMGCIGKSVHSNAREITMQEGDSQIVEEIVEYDSSLPFKQGETRKNNFVRKQSYSSQHSISWGAIMVNNSLSFGSYSAVVDYMDMNGDGYPDFVGKDGIQYSMPWGGIGKLMKVENFSEFKSATEASGIALSACPAQLKKMAGNSLRDGKFHLNGSMGASEGTGTTSTKVQFMDVNADGLPDKIDVDNNKIYYNLGYKFSTPYNFGEEVSRGSSTNGGVSLNLGTLAEELTQKINISNFPEFSVAQVSISGGVGTSSSTNKTEELLIDINGDGLPDKLTKSGSRFVHVAYNKGNNQFTKGEDLSGVDFIGRDETRGVNTTLGVTCGISFGVARIDFGIQSSPYTISISDGKAMLTDMDGDGLADFVYQDAAGKIVVQYNDAHHVNLLTEVTNPTGQSIRLNYTLSEPSSSHRSRQWNLSSVSCMMLNHPMQEMQKTDMQIDYDSAYYDNYERTDYGYKRVTTIVNKEKVTSSVYHNRSLLLNGELIEDSVMDTDKNMYVRHFHGKKYKEIGTDKEYDSADICTDDANTIVAQDGYWTEYYEKGKTSQITTHYDIVYDNNHNMISYIDEGDTAIPDDDWRQEITYLKTTANNMISLPETELVLDQKGNSLRLSSVEYSSLGEPVRIHFDDKQGTRATTHVGYDNYGNVEIIYAPEDVNKKNNWSAFEYDPLTHTYVVSIDNPHQSITRTEYDYRWGLPTKIADPAGYEIRYEYDYKGRLEKVLAPREIQNGNDYTVKYTYNLINHNLKQKVEYPYTHVVKDMYDSAFVQKELSLFDGRGRMIQKKHYAEVRGNKEWVVDGAEEWDVFGRPIAQGAPFVSSVNPCDYEPIGHSLSIVTTQYDILDRPVVQINADGTKKSMHYHFAKDINGNLRLATRVDDENKTTTTTLTSPQEWTIQQIAGDRSSTFFEYSPIGELLRTTDSEGYQTTYNYDMFGRMISRIHPDAGETKMEYDLAGNLIAKQTANLAVTNESIQYHYDFGRLMEIHYPHHLESDVHYLYDSVGRVALREDGTGSETFLYDELGNLAQSLRRIIIPTENQTYMFKTQYKYDSFGRMRNIIYPDGEVVYYGYTTGGILKYVAGKKKSQQNIYLWDRQYDEQGRKVSQVYGNGVWAEYTYDPNRQWLDRLYTELPSGDALQNLQYSYDPVGNIMDIDQSALSPAGTKLGGPYDNHYIYDQQYRLTQSYGKGDFPYTFNAHYSPAGKMGNKVTMANTLTGDLWFGYDQMHKTHQPRTMYDPNNGTLDLYWDANGNLAQMIDCKQNSGRLHEWDEENRLRFVLGEKFAGYYGYDANGERVYKLTGISNLGQVNSGSIKAQAIFDDAVLYPNPYIVISQTGYTKHYYAGTERLATVIGGGGFGDMGAPIDKPTQREQEIVYAFDKQYQQSDPFWQGMVMSYPVPTEDIEGEQRGELEYICKPTILDYVDVQFKWDILLNPISVYAQLNSKTEDIFFSHSDHLGSANWITDTYGSPIQYIHYAPYGELIENQHIGSWYDERYKFTGKERDWETGYDYFGARYWWRAGTWLSVDPLSDKYPHISPYAYCGWNPVNKIDPDGREEWSLDINTGKFQNIGDKGGSITDYYSVGTYEGEKFSSYSNYEIERGDGAINSFRIQETDKSTISAFHIPEENTSGFILERPGPDTSESGQSLRIPAGQYGLHANDGSHYPGAPRLYLPNEGIEGNFDKRGILIHVGNYPEDSKGCLLPGSIRTKDFVGHSGKTLPMISGYCVSKKWMVKLNIFNAFK